MDSAIQEKFLTSFGGCFQPPFTGSIYQWAEDDIELPSIYAMPGSFSVEPSPYLKDVFDAIQDPTVEQVNFVGARQVFKSGLLYVSIAYWSANEPGPVLLLMQTDPAAETFAKTRLVPILQNCKSREEKSIKYSAKTGDVSFAGGYMTLTIAGHKESVLIGKSIRYLCLDEF
jgi:phage terminase large subunit GpA-like protein